MAKEGSSSPPKRAKKEPSQRGPTGNVPVPPPPPALSPDDLARQVTAKCRGSVTGTVGLAVRDTVPAVVGTALEATMKGKAEARVQRLQVEGETLKTLVVDRDEGNASLKARMKDLEAENLLLQ